MKYSISIEIDLPRSRVIELFASTENMSKWQPSLVSTEHICGESGQVGAKMKLVHKMGKREVEMIETITRREFPDLFVGTYEAKGVWNEVINHFTEIEDARTGWRMDTEFQCKGVMWVMCTLMPFMFKKETSASIRRFKTFAEGAGSPSVRTPPAQRSDR